MIELHKYLQDEYIDKKSMLKSQAVTSLASDFNVTYGTVYRWLKTDDHFVMEVSDDHGDIAARVAMKQVAVA